MPSDSNTPSTDKPLRMEITNESIRGLILINGGGAVSLLAFLQAIWTEDRSLGGVILVGMSFFALGLVSAAIANFIRVESSLAHEGNSPNRRSWAL